MKQNLKIACAKIGAIAAAILVQVLLDYIRRPSENLMLKPKGQNHAKNT